MTTFIEHNKKALVWAAAILLVLVLALWIGPLLADKKPARIVQTLISGLLTGGIYALIALGIVIINKASGVFNFAHGWMMLFGGLIFWSFFSVAQISPLAAIGLP
ncbi:MAG: hypothetical protein JNM70_18995, partial [Anaerolineae bacterium]|nr:hypothetical protein [Anaerolineae bacterium]